MGNLVEGLWRHMQLQLVPDVECFGQSVRGIEYDAREARWTLNAFHLQ